MRALIFRRRAEQDLEDEVEFHLAMQRRKHRAAGHSEAEAARLAQRDFGGVASAQEACRDTRGTQAIETALQDIRYALRGFRRSPGFVATMAGTIALAVGGLALLLTISGIYGVLSYLVAQRRQEIGIRVALGATAGAVTGLVMRQSLRLAGIGMALALPVALGVGRLLGAYLVFMRAFDAAAFGVGMGLVAGAAVAAGAIPCRRAARIDPIQTLRCE